jgi:hypothetical protein
VAGTRIRCGAAVGLALLVAVAAAPGTAAAASVPPGYEVVPLAPGLPDTLSAADAARFGLYDDVAGLRRLWFLTAPWGGFQVRMEVEGADGADRSVLRERNVARARWRRYRRQVAIVRSGGVLPAPAATDAGDTIRFDADRLRVWPEVPLPPPVPGPPIPAAVSSYPAVGGRWVTMLEAGYQHNVSSFDDFFSGMITFGVLFGYTVSDHLLPYFGFDIGFGDITKDLEYIAGDGRSNTYNFSLGLLGRAQIGRRTALYLSGAGGYFVRTLQWGGTYEDPVTGRVEDGYVLEQQDPGIAVRVGIQFQSAHPRRLRAWDVGLTLRYTPADRWAYFRDDVQVAGDRSDTWLALTVRFWDTL